jgi:hypothetical protein
MRMDRPVEGGYRSALFRIVVIKVLLFFYLAAIFE